MRVANTFFWSFATERGCSSMKFFAGGTQTAHLSDFWNMIPWLDWSWTWEAWVQSQIMPLICFVILYNFLSPLLMTAFSLQSCFIAGFTCLFWCLYTTCTVSPPDMKVSGFWLFWVFTSLDYYHLFSGFVKYFWNNTGNCQPGEFMRNQIRYSATLCQFLGAVLDSLFKFYFVFCI